MKRLAYLLMAPAFVAGLAVGTAAHSAFVTPPSAVITQEEEPFDLQEAFCNSPEAKDLPKWGQFIDCK